MNKNYDYAIKEKDGIRWEVSCVDIIAITITITIPITITITIAITIHTSKKWKRLRTFSRQIFWTKVRKF